MRVSGFCLVFNLQNKVEVSRLKGSKIIFGIKSNLYHQYIIMERSLLIIKPDGVARSLTGEILSRFEKKGFKIIGTKFLSAESKTLADHYAEHYGKPYYPLIEQGMMMGPIFVFGLEGPVGTVEVIRKMLGKTDPMKAEPGTIRGDYCVSMGRNVCHASDSVESAERELKVWFKPEELITYTSINNQLFYRQE